MLLLEFVAEPELLFLASLLALLLFMVVDVVVVVVVVLLLTLVEFEVEIGNLLRLYRCCSSNF